MGKKIKLDFGEFVHFLDKRKNGYYDFYRTALIKGVCWQKLWTDYNTYSC